MRKINISFYLLSGFILFLTSCAGTEDNLFDEPAALRINHAVKDAQDLLVSAENGWIMQYFPTDDQSGVTFLIKFKKDGKAEMATKNEYFTAYTPDSTAWDIVAESGPILTFNTYGKIFHLFSNPASGLGQGLGVGLEGDYEFIVMSHTNDFVQLKGKKRGTDITLNRLPANQDWKEYFSTLDNMHSFLFNAVVNCKLNLLIDNKPVYTLSNGISHIFTAVPADENDDNREFPFVITEKGLRLSKATEIGDKSVRTFELSEDKNSLICVDEGVNVSIEGSDPVTAFHELIDKYGKRWSILYENSSLSPVVESAYNRVVQSFASRNIVLGQVSYLYNSRNNTNAVYIASVTGTGGYLFFDKEQFADGAKYTFKNTFDSNGRTFYNNYDGVADLITLMSGSFKIEILSSQLNPNKIKFTSISDASIWFTLVLQ